MEVFQACPICATDASAFHRNALIEFAYCPHRQLGVVKPEVGWWQVRRNLSICEFADFTIAMTCMSAFDPDFWKQIIPPGSEGLK
jgi:hypothetical protein